MSDDSGSSVTLRQCDHRFGDFLLSPERQILSYKSQPVALGGRGFDILTLLVTRAGEVVTSAAVTHRFFTEQAPQVWVPEQAG